jgi:hypothetical protein
MFERWIAAWTAWWQTIPPEFAFLLGLPIVVAAAGLWADWRRRRKAHTRPGRAARH